MTIYDPTGSPLGEAYEASGVSVYCTGSLYCWKQELKFLYKKKQISNERLYRAHSDCFLTMARYVSVCRDMYKYEAV